MKGVRIALVHPSGSVQDKILILREYLWDNQSARQSY